MTTTPPIRAQRFYVTRRLSDGLYLRSDKNGWTDDVSLAHIVSKRNFRSLIRAELGRDLEGFEMIEARPALLTTDEAGP